MMFGPSGYYTQKIDFQKDFGTYASVKEESETFSAAIAHQLFSIRNRLIKQGKLENEKPFNVVEYGAGDGDLCFNMMNFISKLAKKERAWLEFYNSIYYHIVEISPKLVQRQKKRNQVFGNKVKVISGDARKPIPELRDKPIAAKFANEILDMISPEELSLNERGDICINFLIPYIEPIEVNQESKIKREEFNVLLKASELLLPKASGRSPEERVKACLEKLKKQSEKYKKLYSLFCPQEIKKDYLLLSEENFLILHKVAMEQNKSKIFQVLRLSIEANSFPEFSDEIKQYLPFTERMDEKDVHHTRFDSIHFLKQAYAGLMPGDELILIDYGHHMHDVYRFLRAYKSSQLLSKWEENPGCQDITGDVDFSVLEEMAKQLGFKKIFYSPQKNLALNFSEHSSLSNESVIDYLKNCGLSTFKFVVHRKPDQAQAQDQLEFKEDLSKRFIGENQPVSRDELFNSEQERLRDKFKTSQASVSIFNDGPHAKLVTEMTKLCAGKPEFSAYFKAIKEKDYSGALRMACKQGLLLHTTALLKYRETLKFDINGVSQQEGGLTAYDLLLRGSATFNPQIFTKIKKMLEEHGAKKAGDLKQNTERRMKKVS